MMRLWEVLVIDEVKLQKKITENHFFCFLVLIQGNYGISSPTRCLHPSLIKNYTEGTKNSNRWTLRLLQFQQYALRPEISSSLDSVCLQKGHTTHRSKLRRKDSCYSEFCFIHQINPSSNSSALVLLKIALFQAKKVGIISFKLEKKDVFRFLQFRHFFWYSKSDTNHT